jgi:hypothetical protein
MPAKRQSIRVPEIRNHYKENTNKKSVSRGRVGGVGCFAVSLPSTISLDSIATQQEGIYYLNANTTISSNQTLHIKMGQQLRSNKTPAQINGNIIPGTYFTLTNNGTIILDTGNDTIPSGMITTINQNLSSFPSTVAFTNTGTITCNTQSNLLINGMVNSGTININGIGAVITIPADASSTCNFTNTNTGIINNNKGVIFFSNTFMNSGTITNNSVIYIGSLGVGGTLINQSGGTIDNRNGTITKNSGSTFTNNGTYKGPPPAS